MLQLSFTLWPKTIKSGLLFKIDYFEVAMCKQKNNHGKKILFDVSFSIDSIVRNEAKEEGITQNEIICKMVELGLLSSSKKSLAERLKEKQLPG